MRVLIIDDSALWIKQGKALLEPAGYDVTSFEVRKPKEFTSKTQPEEVEALLREADVLLIDKDLGKGVTSTLLICVARHIFPRLPIVRWTGGYEDKPYMRYLGVSKIRKPTRRNEEEFVEKFEKAFEEQRLILAGPMAIYEVVDETTNLDEYQLQGKENRLRQVAQIAQLANVDIVASDHPEFPWEIFGSQTGTTKHELGHAICDGLLTVDDIRPYLADLQKVIARWEEMREIDERFKICAEFIKKGKLDELELVRKCY